MKKDLLLGIDFGTGGCKITLLDTIGNLVDTLSSEYPTYHHYSGWAEQNPGDWYHTMCRLLKEMRPAEKGNLLSVALDSYTHGAVLLDKKQKVIRPTIIWTDQRSTTESGYLLDNYGDMIFKTAFQMPAPTWTLPQMLWLSKHEAESYSRIHHISFVKDYVRYLLTGNMACDTIEAQGTLFWDMTESRWSEDLCALANIPLDALPETASPTEMAGKVTFASSQETGLPTGLPVVMGTSDSAIEAFGAGAVNPGQCILKLATAGNVNIMTNSAKPHLRTLTYSHVVPGMWYTVSATNAAAVCQRWYRNASGNESFQELNELATASPCGSKGIFFHPYLMGERSPYWDSDLRGSFTGLSMRAGREDMSRAVLEGVAYSLKDCYRSLEEMGLTANQGILIGGGAKSDLWCQIVSDSMSMPLQCPVGADASYGSALLAGVGIGVFPDCRSAIRQCASNARIFQPNPEAAEFYSEAYMTYRRIHDALSPVYAQVAQTTIHALRTEDRHVNRGETA